MRRAVFPPPIPGDSRWQVPFGGLVIEVAVAAWRRGEWLIAHGRTSVGRARPEFLRGPLAYAEAPEHAVRRMLRGLGLRCGPPRLLTVGSHKARQGHWELTLVCAAPVTGKTRVVGGSVPTEFLPGRSAEVAAAFLTAGLDRLEVEQRLGIERRRQRGGGSAGAAPEAAAMVTAEVAPAPVPPAVPNPVPDAPSTDRK